MIWPSQTVEVVDIQCYDVILSVDNWFTVSNISFIGQTDVSFADKWWFSCLFLCSVL